MANQPCEYCGRIYQAKGIRPRKHCSRACNVAHWREQHPPSERFWSLVAKGPGCWEWQGGRSGNGGYGAFSGFGSNQKAHRLAYELSFGEIPTGLLVCHRCDNPPCVRPDHLFLGTNTDNRRDCITKGRAVFGEPKLTTALATEIRAIYAAGGTKQGTIAQQFGVSQALVSQVTRGVAWPKERVA